MKFKALLLASVIGLTSTTITNAADVILPAEPTPAVVAPSFSWTGAYLGGQIGYGWGKSVLESFGDTTPMKPNGFLGGVYAGYNVEVGNNFFLGIDADATYNNAKESIADTDDLLGTLTIENRLRWSGAVRARVGAAVDRFLPYIAGGVAFGSLRNSLSLSSAFYEYGASQSKTLTGWTLGAGVDYAMTDNLIVRLEYRYTDFGSKNFHGSNDGFEFLLDSKIKTNDIRLGVAYKF